MKKLALTKAEEKTISAKRKAMEKKRYMDPLSPYGFEYFFGLIPNQDLLEDLFNTVLSGEGLEFKDLFYLSPISSSPAIEWPEDLPCAIENTARESLEVHLEGTCGKNQVINMSIAKLGTVYILETGVVRPPTMLNFLAYRKSEKPPIDCSLFIIDEPIQLNSKNSEEPYWKVEKEHGMAILETKEVLNKVKHYYFETSTFTKTLAQLQDRRDKWFYLLKHIADMQEIPEPFLHDAVFSRVFDALDMNHLSNQERSQYGYRFELTETRHILRKKQRDRDIARLEKEAQADKKAKADAKEDNL